MDLIKTKARVIIGFTLCILLTGITQPISLAVGADIAPPKITVISPLNDSKVDTGTPRIEVSCSDISGIQSETIYLFVDRIEVTAKAVIEQEDVTGQVLDSPWHISYVPEVALVQGKHEARFSVEDRARNRAELSWNFEVTTSGGSGGIRIGGMNTLRLDESPVREMTDTWDTTIQGRYGGTDIKLNVAGKITNYPGSETNIYYSYQEYNFYFDDYSLGFYRNRASVIAGRDINASLDSELLEIGLTLKGIVAANSFTEPWGQYHWTFFSGESGSSYATSANLYDMSGAGGDWRTQSGNMQIGAYYVNLSGSKSYRYTGLRWNAFLADFGILRFETIYGLCETSESSGLGWTLHWDKSLGGIDLGLDYSERQPDYPVFGSSSWIESSKRGLRTYGMRTSAVIDEKRNLSFEGTYSVDNLDHTFFSTETHRYITTSYNYLLNPNFSLNTNYQGDFENIQSSLSSEDKTNQSFTVGIGQNIGISKLNISYTLDTARYPDAGDTYDGSRLLSSLTYPIGSNNLTPSIEWSYKKYLDGDYSKAVETRLTWDRKLYSDSPRSSIAFFYKVTDEMDPTHTRIISYGLLPSIYLRLGPNSTLTLVYDYKWYRRALEDTEGINTTVNLTWKLVF